MLLSLTQFLNQRPLEGLDTRLDPASSTSFLRSTTCRISSERTSYVWRAIPLFSINIYRRYGPRLITATDVGIPQVYWKSGRESLCILTCSKPHPRTNETDRVSRQLRMQEVKYVNPSSCLSVISETDFIFVSLKPPEYFL